MADILLVTTSSSLYRWTAAAVAPEQLTVAAHGSQFGIALAIADQAVDLVLIDADFPGLDVPLTCYLLKQWRPAVSIVVVADRPIDAPKPTSYDGHADGTLTTRQGVGEFARAVLGHLRRPKADAAPVGVPPTPAGAARS